MSEPITRERQVFDPDSIRDALELHLPEALRALADAIEAKDIDGQIISVKANAMSQHWRDTRMHLLVTLDIAAQAFRWSKPVEGALMPLDQRPTLELPSRRRTERPE